MERFTTNSDSSIVKTVRFDGNNWSEVQKFLDTPGSDIATYAVLSNKKITIKTKTGTVEVAAGDYILLSAAGALSTVAASGFTSNYTAIVE